MKKGQVTIFIIIGILILVIFFVMYSFVLSQEESMPIQGAETIVLRLYLEQCVKESSNAGLKLIGLQGGRINVSNDFVEFQKDYSESLRRVKLLYDDFSEVNYSAPNFPCKKQGLSGDFECYFEYKSGSLKYPHAIYNLLPLNQGSDSIKIQLQNYIIEKVNECINEGLKNNLLPSFITKSESFANVEFLPESTLVTFNRTIEQDGESGIVEMTSIIQEIPVRFDRIYNYVKQLIFYDLTLPLFNISRDYNQTTLFFDSYIIENYTNYEDTKDVFIFFDESSRLNDKPYRFQFSRQNFPPFLNYIDKYKADRLIDIYVNIPDDLGYTFITIEPKGFDLNEDSLEYSYSGWRQDYEGKSRSKITDPDRKWMSSGYNFLNGIATIKVDIGDLGDWETILTVTDGEFSDYQIINIHVTD